MATASGLASCGPCGNWHKVETRVRTDITVSIRKYAANTREYAANILYARIRENTRRIREHTRGYARIRRYAGIHGKYARIRENTREYAGLDARRISKRILYSPIYAANTQDMHKDTRRILKNTRRTFLSIRRVFAYGFGYISHRVGRVCKYVPCSYAYGMCRFRSVRRSSCSC